MFVGMCFRRIVISCLVTMHLYVLFAFLFNWPELGIANICVLDALGFLALTYIIAQACSVVLSDPPIDSWNK